MVVKQQRASGPVLLALAGCGVLLALSSAAIAQQLIGYVPAKDADVSGSPDTIEGRIVLTGAAVVTAKDHTAPIALARGGNVRVCQTSVIHLTESKAAPLTRQLVQPLLVSLDRGAVEVQMNASDTDALMTPDLRLAVRSPGPLDLRVRVARNGDTCVENRGTSAPSLAISDLFGESSYQLNPGQHVLFEHGSLKEVVDHETIPCGCPEINPGMSLADALLAPGASHAPAAPQAAAQHPFPAAQSEGLAPTPPVPQAPPGEVHTQVSASLTYNAAQPATAATPAAGKDAPGSALAPQPAPVPQSHGVFHSIGHFFKKVFGVGGS